MPIIDNEKYLCIGCGGCSYKCPKHCISLKTNLLGQFTPIIDREACIECKLCERVCPVYSNPMIERKPQYNDIVGNYVSCFMGYDESLRKTSASGGFVTGVLKSLLDQNIIDYAVCLRNSKQGESFYRYEFIENSENLILCSRSAYYPVEMSQMLRKIKENPGKYAIVVLPCQAKAINSILKIDPVLSNRIVFLLGLVCGGMPGSSMVDYLAESIGLNKTELSRISFREKDCVTLNRDYGISFVRNDGKILKNTYNDGTFGFAFINKLFHYRGCNVCDDIFAEYADAAFMDAWLPEYNNEKLGRSICIVRNEKLLEAIGGYFRENPNCEEVPVEIPIRAQNSVGLIQRKKRQAYFKRSFYKRLGFIVPKGGIQRFSISEKLKFSIRTIQEYLIQNKSEKYWREYKSGTIDFMRYNSTIHKYIRRIKKI